MSIRRRAARRRRSPSLLRLALIVVAALSLAACGGDDGSSGSDAAGEENRLVVASTVSPLTNLLANVAGGRAEVIGIVPEGENSHEFEPAPSVAKTLARADVVFINGLELETPTKEMAEANRKEGSELVELGNQTITRDEWIFDFSFPEEHGDPNPHLWTNPPYAKRYAEIMKDTLARRDPANAATYEANYERLAEQIDSFSAALREATATVPTAKRKLLTYHDSFPYFARDFDWRVIGAIQPSDFADPTPREVANLIAQVEREEVPAIFGSEVFPSPVLEQIAKESGAEYVDDLRDDDLPGRPGAADHSLLGLLQFDYITIVEALGGDASTLKATETTNPVSDEADYPQ